ARLLPRPDRLPARHAVRPARSAGCPRRRGRRPGGAPLGRGVAGSRPGGAGPVADRDGGPRSPAAGPGAVGSGRDRGHLGGAGGNGHGPRRPDLAPDEPDAEGLGADRDTRDRRRNHPGRGSRAPRRVRRGSPGAGPRRGGDGV
ncbi:MAG: hypothetical protein AVDCRST_MAG73-888, partial [uncultured Thermomicrobiales bacterium]